LNYLDTAQKISLEIERLARENGAHEFVIEQLNLGRSVHHQKILEWIHCCVINRLKSAKVSYLGTGEWRKILGLKLSSEHRQLNKHINAERAKLKKKIEKELSQAWKQELIDSLKSAKDKREANSITKKFEKKVKSAAARQAGSVKIKIDGQVVGLVNEKNLSVNYVNQHYDLNLLKKDNDIADAVCLGEAYVKKTNA
jgi:hypothetical protein